MNLRFWFFIIGFLFIIPQAHAKIALSNVIVDFHQGAERHKDITITNISKETLYINVSVKEVVNPGLESEERVELKKGDASHLIVSPRRMVLKASERKTIRLVSRAKDLTEDKVYRVHVSPVVGKVKATQNMLKIMIAYDMLIIFRPNEMKPSFSATRTGKNITFKNTGNTNILLREGAQCPGGVADLAKDDDSCERLPGKRLYAGMTFNMELPKDAPVEFLYSIGEDMLKKSW